MGSGMNHSAVFHYEGNGSATPREFKPGFEPKYMEVRSVEGQVKLAESEAAPWKQDAAGAISVLAADALKVLKDFGIKLASTDDALNKVNTEYVLMCWA